jgi:LPS-assembly protein
VLAARVLIASLAVLLLILPGRSWAAALVPAAADGEQVDLEADQLTFDGQLGRYLASGNVRLRQGELQLHSDELWWHRESGAIEASGGVVLEGEGERLSGQRVRYNLNDGTGLVEEGRAFLREQNLRISGARIEKRGASDYRIVDGSFTTCEAAVPSWKFGAGQLDVTAGGYARARHAVFYLKDLPVFYVPYLIYPAKTERESGLLMPRVGYSDRRGMEFSAAYYQVLRRNQDATLYLDYLSDLGLGKGLEYRYVFARDNAGEAEGYHIDAEDGDDRYALDWEHRGTLPGRVRLSADTEYVSDRDYFADFGEEAGEYNKDQSLSIVALSRNWGLYNLVGELRYSENLQRDEPTTLQRLPRISFDAVRQRLGATPFYFAFGSEYTYFWRQEGLKGQRLRVRPALLATWKLWDAVDVIPELGWTERHYWTSGDQSGHQQQGLYDFSTRLSSRFYRVYSRNSASISRIRHMLEPDLAYFYVPDVDQQRLPEFDDFDRIDKAHRIEYGLTQRLTTRSDSGEDLPEYRDLLFFRLSQGYDLRDREGRERFTPLRGLLRLRPAALVELSADLRFDVEAGRWHEYSGAALFRDLRGNRLGLQYRKPAAAADAAADQPEVDYGSLELKLAWLKPVYLGYRNRYDFVAATELEQVLDIEYRHQCWSLFVTLRDRDDEQSIMLSFSLGGIGMVGSVGGNLGGS